MSRADSSRPEIRIIQGDLARQEVDAIVNAANEGLRGGGGVDGAVHAAAGPRLLEACRALPEVLPGVRCPTGEARLTPGFDLPAGHVIHTVGPVYRGSPDDAELLASAFRSPLALAVERGFRSIAFPAVSCGVYGYPVAEAARIARQVVEEKPWNLDEIRFVLFDQKTLDTWQAVFAE